MLNRLKEEDRDRSYVRLKNYIRNEIPWIHVLKLPETHPLREYGEYITLDNRRLFCFRMVLRDLDSSLQKKIMIPVYIRSYE